MKDQRKDNLSLVLNEVASSNIGRVALFVVGSIGVIYISGKVFRVLGGTILDFKHFSKAIKS